ncbi:MAG: hypothetical protein U0L98_07235 [Clostridia bacterium]|nr:hypothetical protein [Clostridia bacterium]
MKIRATIGCMLIVIAIGGICLAIPMATDTADPYQVISSILHGISYLGFIVIGGYFLLNNK